MQRLNTKYRVITKENTGIGIMGLALIAASALGTVIHIWTIIIAYLASGLLAAIFTSAFPVLSEIYWFFRIGSNAGFDVLYCISIMSYVGLFGVAFLGLMVVASGDN